MKKLVLFFAFIIAVLQIFNVGVIQNVSAKPLDDLIIYNKEQIVQVSADANNRPFWEYIFGVKKEKSKNTNTPKQTQPINVKKVYVGGNPLGFTLHSRGVIIVGISEVETNLGKVSTTTESNIKEGDILISINNINIIGANSISNFLRENYTGGKADIVLMRDGKEIKTTIHPAKDTLTNEYKLGLWIRDNSAGVGTLTFVTEDMKFGALGHSVCDLDTKQSIPVADGNIYKCNVIGVQRSISGKPGELRGLFLKNATPLGKIQNNEKCGVFGKLENSNMLSLNKQVEVAEDSEIKMGKATLLTTIEGVQPKEYNIEIIKTDYINTDKHKCFVIRVTDEKLLNLAGGIVQGMSGSPIIQNGKIVGAVTHVFVNDSTKGFAINISEMLNKID